VLGTQYTLFLTIIISIIASQEEAEGKAKSNWTSHISHSNFGTSTFTQPLLTIPCNASIAT